MTPQQRVVEQSNLMLSGAYILLLIASLCVIFHQLRSFGKFNLGILFAVEIAIQSSVRITFFFLSIFGNTWQKVLHLPHGPSYMLFVDLFPEILFFAIYLLLVVTWGVAWLKSKGMKLYSVNQILPIYMTVVVILFLGSGALSLAARLIPLVYEEVVMWEVAYLVTLTSISILATAIAGSKLYLTLKNKRYVDDNYVKYMLRLSILIIFTSISFTLKGIWAYSFSDLVRKKWVTHDISGEVYSVLRFLYFFLSEILPEGGGLFFRYLNSRRTQYDGVQSRSKINIRDSDAPLLKDAGTP